jgi:hypothetical protein
MITMKKDLVLLDIYHAYTSLESVFLHDIVSSAQLGNSDVRRGATTFDVHLYMPDTGTSRCKPTWQMMSADDVTQRLIGTDVVGRCQKCKCAL